jgi:hypothetical protein
VTQLIIPGNTLRAAAIANAKPGDAEKAALDAEVMPALAALKLDRAQAQAIGAKGDLLLFRTWKDFGMGSRPAMLLARKRCPAQQHVFFPLESLYLIDGDRATDVAMTVAEQLYGIPTKQDAYRVLDCLFEFAEDLLRTPPNKRVSAREWLAACAEDGLTIYAGDEALNA